MDRTKTPVALFTYNRPEHTRLALETLIKCARLDECSVRIYCDGARSEEHMAGVEGSRRVVREYAPRLNATVIERDENLGLSRSIVTGVTELCREAGRVIVVEDDFALGTDFLNYMLTALDRYEAEPNVYQISGYMFPVAHPPQPDAFFLGLITTWGWATWQRAWRIFDWEAQGAREMLADPFARRRFDLDDSYPYSAMLEMRLDGLNDSWGILWWWAVFKAGGLALHPRQSLVSNDGFDGTGVHCGETPNFAQPSRQGVLETRLAPSLKLPDEIAEDEKAFQRIKALLRDQTTLKPSLTARLKRRIARYVSSAVK